MAEDDLIVRAGEAVVAGLLGKVRPLVEAVARVQVRSADPAAQHPQADLPGTRVGLGPVGDGELGVLADDGADGRDSTA